MIVVDDRVGSKELLVPLKAAGLPAEIARLEFGDIAFTGKGAEGKSVDIGIELKTLGDLIGSIRSGRLAGHQLPGLSSTYDYRWLIIEGTWRHDESGLITVYKGKRGWAPAPGRMSASELEKTVLTFELLGGLRAHYSNSRRDTVRFISNLYRWWTDVAMDKHTSHLAVHSPVGNGAVPISRFRQAVVGGKWPHIGLKFSRAVESHFKGSLKRAVNAPEREWAEIAATTDTGATRRLGQKAAHDVQEFLDGRKK